MDIGRWTRAWTGFGRGPSQWWPWLVGRLSMRVMVSGLRDVEGGWQDPVGGTSGFGFNIKINKVAVKVFLPSFKF